MYSELFVYLHKSYWIKCKNNNITQYSTCTLTSFPWFYRWSPENAVHDLNAKASTSSWGAKKCHAHTRPIWYGNFLSQYYKTVTTVERINYNNLLSILCYNHDHCDFWNIFMEDWFRSRFINWFAVCHSSKVNKSWVSFSCIPLGSLI